ncbi:hypothetical protein ACIO6T_43860 [Streptomyces sp. NPDC087532]|uniref:hypothetical protein n=2 Tax=Streptomyces TaxID=1883 RepID=UPI003333702E
MTPAYSRGVLAAAFGPESEGELPYAKRLLTALDETMLLLADATDTVTTGHGIFPGTLVDLVGTIGHAALGDLLPAHRRQRVKARTRKNPTSKYGPNAGQHPQKAQNYTVRTTVAFFAHGLNSCSRR